MSNIRQDLFNLLNMCKGFEAGWSSRLGDNVLYINYNGKPYYIVINEMENAPITDKIKSKYNKDIDISTIQDFENIKYLQNLFSQDKEKELDETVGLEWHNEQVMMLKGELDEKQQESKYWENRCKEIGDVARTQIINEIFADILNEENLETAYFTFDGNIKDKKVISVDTITTLARERGVEVRDIKYGK